MIHYLLTTAIGISLAMIYFAGLWWTVQRLASADHPVAFYLTSLCVRTGAVAAILYLVLISSSATGLIAALFGFLIGRMVMLRWLGRIPKTWIPEETRS